MSEHEALKILRPGEPLTGLEKKTADALRARYLWVLPNTPPSMDYSDAVIRILGMLRLLRDPEHEARITEFGRRDQEAAEKDKRARNYQVARLEQLLEVTAVELRKGDDPQAVAERIEAGLQKIREMHDADKAAS
jgi:hypothetical protein